MLSHPIYSFISGQPSSIKHYPEVGAAAASESKQRSVPFPKLPGSTTVEEKEACGICASPGGIDTLHIKGTRKLEDGGCVSSPPVLIRRGGEEVCLGTFRLFSPVDPLMWRGGRGEGRCVWGGGVNCMEGPRLCGFRNLTWSGFNNKSTEQEAESQWIVGQSLLSHLQYPVPYQSRLQRIYLF